MWPMKDKQAPKVYRYHWLHIPSGRRGVKEKEFDTEADFKYALIRWNKAQKELMKYWAAD